MDNSQVAGNQSSFFGQKVSIPGINVNSAGDNQLILKDNYSSRIYYNSLGIPTVLLGLRTSTTPNQQGLYVSQDGVDVTQASDSQLIFNSNQDIFKIVEKGTATIPSFTIGTGGTRAALLTIAHKLPFTPLANIYVGGTILNLSLNPVASTYIPIPIFISNGTIQYYFAATSGNYHALTIIYGIDATNIYIEAFDGGGAFTMDTINSIPVTYFLLQETAN